MNSKQKLNWGIIGAGLIAHKMADALKINPDSHLLAIASKTPEKAKEFARSQGVELACNYAEIVSQPEIDVIYVATTHNFHFENAKLALEHGKHVLVEKAFTVNAQEARELVQLARDKNLFLMEAMWVRFLPSQKTLKKKIQAQSIGQVKMIDAVFGNFVGPAFDKRLKDPDLAGGVTLDMGIYPISIVCNFLGELPVEVKSMTHFSDRGVDELSNYMFRFPSGCLVNISTGYNLNLGNKMTLYGTEGILEFPDFLKGEQFSISHHGGGNETQAPVTITEKNHTNGFVYQVEEVVSCIHAGELESKSMSLNDTIAIMDVMDQMRNEWGLKYPFE